VVVKGFPDNADETTLQAHFEACGEVVRAPRLQWDPLDLPS
jgi:hypothetical protein